MGTGMGDRHHLISHGKACDRQHFCKWPTQKYNSGNITTSISYHLPQFIIIENGKGDQPTNKTAKTTYRDYKNFDMEPFKIDLQGTDWTFATQNNDVNLGFETFLWLLIQP